jgi:hypothetical protein
MSQEFISSDPARTSGTVPGDRPVAWMWQHGETGATGFIEDASPEDRAQWERMNKPRNIIRPLYTHPQKPTARDRNFDGAEEFVTAIISGQPIWPNSWGQDVALAAFTLTNYGRRPTFQEPPNTDALSEEAIRELWDAASCDSDFVMVFARSLLARLGADTEGAK